MLLEFTQTLIQQFLHSLTRQNALVYGDIFYKIIVREFVSYDTVGMPFLNAKKAAGSQGRTLAPISRS